MAQAITVLGMGAMGSRMADRLEAAGFVVTRWNRTGAAVTPRYAVRGADIVLSMLRDDDAARAVWLDPDNGALAGMQPGALAIESGTLTKAAMRDLGEAAGAQGIAFLDAPVLGSRPQAEAGALIHLVGGEATALERAQPVLAAIGAKQLHVGAVGAGTGLKLVANTLFAGQVALIAELIGLMHTLDLDPSDALALLGQTPLLSPAAAGAANLMLAGRDDPMFPVDLVRKDLGYAIGAAAAAMPVAAAVKSRFDEAAQLGHGGANLTVLHRLNR
jgi:3-hydroxyisobutyrate dehydrogenase-like beta-hydroxyacid dehydrogenase